MSVPEASSARGPVGVFLTLYDDADAAAVGRALKRLGQWATPLVANGRVSGFRIDPPSPAVAAETLAAVPGVAQVFGAESPHPRLDAQAGVSFALPSGLRFGVDEPPVLVVGPCSVDRPETAQWAAAQAVAVGSKVLRGGAFKPRTSPYSFNGHGRPALGWLREAADAHGLAMVTEVMSEREVEAVVGLTDVVQVGSRNMQNFALLRAVGEQCRATPKPVLLKRAMSATVEEWLLAAEHLYAAGCPAVVLCERGVKGFDPQTRNLLDLAAVALLRFGHRLPVWVDPSHATGRRDLLAPLTAAAVAAGACGVMVEIHPDAGVAQSDAPQALSGSELRRVAESFHCAAGSFHCAAGSFHCAAGSFHRAAGSFHRAAGVIEGAPEHTGVSR